MSLLLVTACGDDSGPTGSATTATTLREPVGDAPTCEEWLTRPVEADEVEYGCAETMDGPVTMVQTGMAAIECEDGRTLFFGDQGWGYVGEPMREPSASALSEAQEECPVEFPPQATTDPGFPCPASSDDCTTEEVVATVRQIWELSGATPSEAECMAAINSENTRAVNEALDAYSQAENQAMIDCVGSEARAREIADASMDVVVTVP